MKEQQHVKHLPYLPISNWTIIEALRGKSREQLSELGVSEGLLLMIRQGFAKQLREDVFNKLSQALNLDISADNSSPKQPQDNLRAKDVAPNVQDSKKPSL